MTEVGKLILGNHLSAHTFSPGSISLRTNLANHAMIARGIPYSYVLDTPHIDTYQLLELKFPSIRSN